MFKFNGRKVSIFTGTLSQTVNVRTAKNIRSVYDYKVRLKNKSLFVTEELLNSLSLQTIEDMVEYLVKHREGLIEKEPNQPEKPVSILEPGEPVYYEKEESSWANRAKDIVEESIDQLIYDFVDYPYLHRVEHSIHCELYRILSNRRLFAGQYPVGEEFTQTIHKEWPEYKPRPEKKNRRGNSDLSVITPDALRDASIKDYRNGWIKPCIVIEMGLDYKLDHLDQDLYKLQNSEIDYGYLIHLVREDYAQDNFDEVERFILNNVQLPVKVAYARVGTNASFYKLVNDVVIKKKLDPGL